MGDVDGSSHGADVEGGEIAASVETYTKEKRKKRSTYM